MGKGFLISFVELLVGNPFRQRGGECRDDFQVRHRGGVVHFFARNVLSQFERDETVLIALGFEVRLDEASGIGAGFVLLLFRERPDLSEIAAPEFVDEFLVADGRTLEEHALRYVHASG